MICTIGHYTCISAIVMNDDVLELLQDGWDSSDDESITTREVPPRKVPSTPPREVPSTPPREVPIITRPSPHKQQQESDNDVVSKGKDDIQGTTIMSTSNSDIHCIDVCA